VEVSDGVSIMAAITKAEPVNDAEHGRGLFLLEALSAGWGIEERIGGKSVYFVMAAEPLA
jgi:hypothetical protein